MPQISVGPMVTDKQNNLWLGVYNNGLTCYNIEKGSFRHFTRADGLPATNISALIVIGEMAFRICQL
jgi:ligand-binding sensor domain-containing protein